MKWYVLYTRYYHERAVLARVAAKGFQAYLPWGTVWRPSKHGLRKVTAPLFPRYIFVWCYLEMWTHLELISIPGVLRLLEDAEGQLLVVPDEEMRVLRQLSDAGVSLERVGYQAQGELVHVLHGQLGELRGMLQHEPRMALLVPLPALQTCIAVEMQQADILS